METPTVSQHPLTEKIIGCAIEIHRALGPGLLESAYEQCLARELSLENLTFRLQVPIPVEYKGVSSIADSESMYWSTSKLS